MEINITRRIEWLKMRMKMNDLEQGYIEMMLKDIATEVANESTDIHPVIHCDICSEDSKTGNKVNKICTKCVKEHYV